MTGFVLVDWLRDVHTEVERLAREVEAAEGSHRRGEPYSDGSGTATLDAFPSYPWGAADAELAFMAGPGHPSAVLARVEEERRLLELHASVRREFPSWEDEYGCLTCTGPSGHENGEAASFPCQTVQFIAAGWRWMPGYDAAAEHPGRRS